MKSSHKNVILLLTLVVVVLLMLNPLVGSRGGSENSGVIEEAISLYRVNNSYTGNLSGDIRNFGCHWEVWLYNDKEEVVAKYTQRFGRLQSVR